MNNQLSILIPTSPIPSHPSTAILDETISNIRKYTDARIIIMFDGVHESLVDRAYSYHLYLKEVLLKMGRGIYGDCKATIFEHHTHQAKMTSTILRDEVTTPLIMFVEHDTSPIGNIPFQSLCDYIQDSETVNYIRFSIFHEIPQEHEYLMLRKVHEKLPTTHLTRTIQFSARPHIAKADWYRKLLSDNFQLEERAMIEDKIHGIIQESYKALKRDIFGLAIYTPPGNILRSYHSDARGTDEKIIEG